ncbi:MAG: hypothetical protein ABJE66_20660 [Deltaproteobacteria bacterium]
MSSSNAIITSAGDNNAPADPWGWPTNAGSRSGSRASARLRELVTRRLG